MKSLGALMANVVRIWEIRQRGTGDGGRSSSKDFAQMLGSRVVDVYCGMQAEDSEPSTRDLCGYGEVVEADGNRSKDSRSCWSKSSEKSEVVAQALS